MDFERTFEVNKYQVSGKWVSMEVLNDQILVQVLDFSNEMNITLLMASLIYHVG